MYMCALLPSLNYSGLGILGVNDAAWDDESSEPYISSLKSVDASFILSIRCYPALLGLKLCCLNVVCLERSTDCCGNKSVY